MTKNRMTLRQQRSTVLHLVMAFLGMLLLAQLWLLVNALEGSLEGEGTIVFPVALASGLCFLAAWLLLRALPKRP
jgi:hypothetical protein